MEKQSAFLIHDFLTLSFDNVIFQHTILKYLGFIQIFGSKIEDFVSDFFQINNSFSRQSFFHHVSLQCKDEIE